MGRSIRIALRLMMALGSVAAPAVVAQMLVVQGAHAQSQPPTLPPPPYAANQRTPLADGGPQTYDRYGGGGSHARVQAPGASIQHAAYAGPRLGWSGKTDTAQPQQPRPYARYAVQAQQPQPPAPAGWTYVNPIGARPVEPAAPTSIYDAPPAPVAQMASATPGAGGTRHYSLHSEFGGRPDPIPTPGSLPAGTAAAPLPASFFGGGSPDLSQPETPEPARKVASANGKSRNAIQPEGGQ